MAVLTYKQPTVVSYPPRVSQPTNHIFMIVMVAMCAALLAVAILSLPTVESWQLSPSGSHHNQKSSQPVIIRQDFADLAFNGTTL